MESLIAECIPSIRSYDPAFAGETLADLRAELGRVHPQWRANTENDSVPSSRVVEAVHQASCRPKTASNAASPRTSTSHQPEIDAATLIVCDQLQEVNAMVRPVLEAAGNLEKAANGGDDERCRKLLQQLADDLLASGYKARKRRAAQLTPCGSRSKHLRQLSRRPTRATSISSTVSGVAGDARRPRILG